jgi:hypothetical protein
MLSPSPGNISVIPSLFLDTRRRTSAGVQMLAGGNESATKLAFGFGGIHDLVGEGRIVFGLPRPFPTVLSLEGLADSRSTLDYIGLGQEPDKDPRNHFRADAMTHAAVYYERRVRALASLGMRFGPSFQLFLSSSMLRSRVENTPGGGPSTISNVFVPGTVTGAPGAFSTFSESRIVYTELALRYDTRANDARPSPGVLAEAYGGIARGTGDDPSRFWRGGGRIAAFFPILRNTNILSPRVALDGMIIEGNSAVPFTAFTSQPDFRGIDNRLDKVSLVVSLDYRWSVFQYMGLRMFVDMATVGPDLGAMFDAPKRWAGGFGVDIFSSSSELAQFIASFSNEGARAFFTFGVPPLFGDRQHRR